MKESKFLQKTSNIILKIVSGILIVIFGWLTILNLLLNTEVTENLNNFKEYAYLTRNNYGIIFILIAIFFAILFLIEKLVGIKNISTKKLLIAVLIYTVVIGVTWILVISPFPVNDQNIVFSAGKEFMKGDYSSLEPGAYLDRCPFQLGIVFILSLFQGIFGIGNCIPIMIINVLLIAGCIYILFKILQVVTRNKKNSKTIENVFLLMCFICFQPILYSVFVYGTIIGLFFSLIAIYFTVRFCIKRKPIYYVIIFLSMSIAIIAKSNFIIYGIAIILVLVFVAIKDKKWYFIALACLLLASFLSPKIITNYYLNEVKSSNYEKENNVKIDINNGMPSSVFIAMGMYEIDKTRSCGAAGWYNAFNYKTYKNTDGNKTKSDNIGKKYISNRLKYFKSHPEKAISFYYEKMGTQWSEPTFQTFWMIEACANYDNESYIVEPLINGIFSYILSKIMKLMLIITFSGTLVFLIRDFKRLDIFQIILLIIVAGGFLFSILWEAKALYIMPYYLLSMPTGAIGVTMALGYGKRIIEKIFWRKNGSIL